MNAIAAQYRQAATFRAALARFSRAVEETCRRHHLTTDQYTLLVMIKGAPAGTEQATATDIAERLHLSVNGITERLQRAEAEGLIRRDRSIEDRRVSYLRLTKDAERRLSGAFHALQEDAELVSALREALTAFTTEQLQTTPAPDDGLSPRLATSR